MNSKFQFGFIFGIIALTSGQAFADEVREWVTPVAVGVGTVASMTAVSKAASSTSDRLQNQIKANAFKSSAEIQFEVLQPLLNEKTQLERRLKASKRIYESEKAKLEDHIKVSHELRRVIPGRLHLAEDGLTPEVSLAFKSVKITEKLYNDVKKEIDFLDKRIAAIPKNLESNTYSYYLTAADTQHIERVRLSYHNAKLRESELEKLVQRSGKLARIAKMSEALVFPVTLATTTTSALVTNKLEKAKEEAAAENPSSAQTQASPTGDGKSFK